MGSCNLFINFFDISVISQREHPIDFPDFGRGAQRLKRERDRRDAAILHPSVKSGRFLAAAAPFFACGDAAEFLGPFPRSKIPNHPAAANVVAL